MSVVPINLSDPNRRKLAALSHQTGKSEDELVNEAVERLTEPADTVPDWKRAILQAGGMWKDRDDIPWLMAQLRREWNKFDPPDDAP